MDETKVDDMIETVEETENINKEEISEQPDTLEGEDAVKPIEPEKAVAAVEAILFSMGDAISVKELCKVLATDDKTILNAIDTLSAEYENDNRGIRIIKLEDSYQLCTKNEYYEYLIKLVNMPKKHSLTDSLLETLSIIAYKQPITRQEIESIRGVSCVHAINRLMEYKLVAEVGRLDAVGRPILFGTTEEFLRSFGVTSMDELPIITPDKIEDFRQQAMEEVNIKVEV